MRLLTNVLLALHIAFGTAAIVAGLAALLTVKGRGTHRRSGRVFLRCMAMVIGSAAVLSVLRFNPYLAGLTASAAIGTVSGWRVLRRKRPDLDPRQRATTFDWATAWVVLLVSAWLLALVSTGRLTENRPVVFSMAYGAGAFALWDLWRFWRPTAFPCTPNLWLYEHIVKILGAYFGAVAAFSGSVLVLLDPPWRQLWAVMLGQALAVLFVVRERRRLARARGPAALRPPPASGRA
jgi:hypothetical protein